MSKDAPDLADLRSDYLSPALRRADLSIDPTEQLERWLGEAHASGAPDANAMALATADRAGQPSVRNVLLKGLDAEGLRFFTHRDSQKGHELAENPRASVCFLWHGLHRQVRVAGTVEALDEQASYAYFSQRPRGSQLGAWASPQTEVLPDREALEKLLDEAQTRFRDRPIPLPDRWGGYLLSPTTFEFWQGQPNRLHDRFRYRLAAPVAATEPTDSTPQPTVTRWIIERLAP